MSARYAFIQAQQGEHPVQRLCQVLGVAKAGYYAWHRRQQQGPRPRVQADTCPPGSLGPRPRTTTRRAGLLALGS